MVYSWRRPSNIPFPSVWLTFKEKDLDNKKLVEYRVQDLPIDRFDDAIKHMTDTFLADVPMCKSKGVFYLNKNSCYNDRIPSYRTCERSSFLKRSS